MSRDSKESIREMQQIQKGLEAFLYNMDKEDEQDDIDVIDVNRSNSNRSDRNRSNAYYSQENRTKENYNNVNNTNNTKRKQTNKTIQKQSYYVEWEPKTEETQNREKSSGRKNEAEKASQKTSQQKSKKSNKKTQEKELKKEQANKPKAEQENKPKKKSKFKRNLKLITLCIVLVLIGFYFVVSAAYDKLNYKKIDSVAFSPMKEDGVVNILLIGNDSRENGEDGRSDAMILLSISNKTKKIYMTSLLRDMYVDIPGHDGNRLNAAYSFGGAELLMETIEQNFDITVNRYMLVNFEAFANLVDAVGGVDLELTNDEVLYVNGYLVEYNMLLDRPQGTDNLDPSLSGMVHLNGPQALAFTRNRFIGTDFGRTERQRKVLSEVIHKMPKAVLTNPKGLIDGLFPNLTTNLTKWECYRLALGGWKFISYDLEQASVPMEGTYKNVSIRGMAVLEVDFDANKKYISNILFGDGDADSMQLP